MFFSGLGRKKKGPSYVSRINGNSSSCLDHLWHNPQKVFFWYKSFYPNLSDYLFISTLFGCTIDDRPILTRLVVETLLVPVLSVFPASFIMIFLLSMPPCTI